MQIKEEREVGIMEQYVESMPRKKFVSYAVAFILALVFLVWSLFRLFMPVESPKQIVELCLDNGVVYTVNENTSIDKVILKGYDVTVGTNTIHIEDDRISKVKYDDGTSEEWLKGEGK